MADRLSTGAVMSAIALEMRESIARLAGPRAWSETRARWLERAARHAKIPYRTARSLFYLERADPKASVVERVRAALERSNRDRISGLRAEYRAVCDQIARLEALETLLAQRDPEFHSPDRSALREMAGRTDSALE